MSFNACSHYQSLLLMYKYGLLCFGVPLLFDLYEEKRNESVHQMQREFLRQIHGQRLNTSKRTTSSRNDEARKVKSCSVQSSSDRLRPMKKPCQSRYLNVCGKTLSLKMIGLGSNCHSIGFPFFRLFIKIETRRCVQAKFVIGGEDHVLID